MENEFYASSFNKWVACVCVRYIAYLVYKFLCDFTVRIHFLMLPKSVTTNIKLNADNTATDTTQARVTLHEIGNIKNSHFRILLHSIKMPETAFIAQLA